MYNNQSKNALLLYMFAEDWCIRYKTAHPDLNVNYAICYNSKTIIMFLEVDMKLAITIVIPYCSKIIFIM